MLLFRICVPFLGLPSPRQKQKLSRGGEWDRSEFLTIEFGPNIWNFISEWENIEILQYLLNKNPVDEDESEGNDEKNVGEVEDEFGDKFFGAIPLHVPVGDTNLKRRI